VPRLDLPQPVLVTFAVRSEARPFRTAAAAQPHLESLITGIGPKSAARTLLESLVNHPLPALVVSAGFAGGLNPDLAPGTIVYDADHAPLLAESLARSGARPARFLSVDHIASTTTAKQTLRLQTSADAVDMESSALREIARTRRLPFAIVRVISDAAHEDLPLDFNRFLDPNGHLRLPSLLLALAASPWRIPPLVRFHHHCREAANHLAQTLLTALTHAEQRTTEHAANPPAP
jgi:adenosylhomocysteine nucleosidase